MWAPPLHLPLASLRSANRPLWRYTRKFDITGVRGEGFNW